MDDEILIPPELEKFLNNGEVHTQDTSYEQRLNYVKQFEGTHIGGILELDVTLNGDFTFQERLKIGLALTIERSNIEEILESGSSQIDADDRAELAGQKDEIGSALKFLNLPAVRRPAEVFGWIRERADDIIDDYIIKESKPIVVAMRVTHNTGNPPAPRELSGFDNATRSLLQLNMEFVGLVRIDDPSVLPEATINMPLKA